ncbi:MAG TPA: universal stress protein [Gaiellaceae bacterium]|jgi:nucleotide-binding universal stress UspA family protein|nr:universal stress protein [Gaiellaceae bacterium]
MKLQTIIVGFDETEPARRALERAADLAEAFGAKLVVTSVAPILVGVARTAGPLDSADSPTEHREQLEDARIFLDGRGIEADYVTAAGEPADTIVELAEQQDADVIVVGTREPGILERLLGQSVSERVAHHAHRDVLIVH